jgi:thiol-disulfide isomerase/thioredoxin
VNCPPCASIAPSFQDLYEEWGEGQNDVQFFEFSNKTWDTNSDVHNWKTNLGLTFPGAGNDGGGFDATKPYTSGTYGPFFGTPTFIVIAPDRSVNYDVRSNGSLNTISMLDLAIAATGAQKPGSMVLPSQFNILAEDAFGTEIQSFEMYLASSNSSTEIPISLEANGYFEVTDLSSEYPGINNPVIRIRKNDEVTDKISAIDILIIVRHILNLIPIEDPRLLLAADTNGDGQISAIDLITLQRVILTITPNFPNKEVYQFVPNEIPINISPGNVQDLNFIGIKTGDLNGF